MGLDINPFLALALSILSSASKQTGLTFPLKHIMHLKAGKTT